MMNGDSSLSGWSDVIRESARSYAEERKRWQEQLGPALQVYKKDGCEFGFWKIPEGVLVAPIGKNGPDPGRSQVYEKDFIIDLFCVLNNE